MEIYLKISKLLLAHKTQNISAQETEELLAWRQEKTENEELFQKISQADGFEQFRQQYEEYDFTPKFLLLEQKIKQEKRKRITLPPIKRKKRTKNTQCHIGTIKPETKTLKEPRIEAN